MTGSDLIRKVRRLGRRRNVPVRVVAHRGKDDHVTLYHGERLTIVGGRGELGKGTLHAMLRRLGSTQGDLEYGR
jgi:ABC-type phosphonate transport system ATPase subunit